MLQRPEDLDWTYIRAFLAVAETGSLTAAAKQIGQSQPTLSRHIKLAETALGTALFTRVSSGLALTEAGRSLLEPARDMARASARFATLAAGQDAELSGTVRITASVVVSQFILPEILAEIRRAAPRIELELVPSDTTESLTYREADIAVRMYRPTQLDIVTRKIGEQPIGLYATPGLLAEHGAPETLDDLGALPFVGFDRSDLIIRSMREVGLTVDRHFFGMRCDNQAAYWALVCAGCGVGAMQVAIGATEPRVTQINVPIDLPSLPIWLAAPEDLLPTPRVRHVWDSLADHLKAWLG